MLPRIAMPNAPPNSEPVSEREAAVPARSGGDDPIIKSVANVNTGEIPMENRLRPVTNTIRSESPLRKSKSENPAAAINNPKIVMVIGLIDFVIDGVDMDPTINPSAEGKPHNPA